MKKQILYNLTIIAITIAVLSSCTIKGTLYDMTENPTSDEKITMTVENQKNLNLTISGEGAISIDWGDGSTPENFSISSNGKDILKNYANAGSYNIIISGGSISEFDCSYNDIKELDISSNSKITNIVCNNNQLTKLTFGNNPSLKEVICDNNSLTSLDLKENKAVNSLFCNDNKLTSLTINNCTVIKVLLGSNNELTGLDLGNNQVISRVDICNNKMNTSALNTLLNSLHDKNISDDKTVMITNNPGASTCDKANAIENGWTVVD